MTKFQINLQELNEVITPNNNKIPLKGNENRIIRVAFDLFRFKDGNPEELWQVQSSDDGEYLVRTYSIPEDEEKTASCKWSVELDKREENLTIAYESIPILRLAGKNYGISASEDIRLFQRCIYKKLAADNDFVVQLVQTLPAEKQLILKEAGFCNNTDSKLIILEQQLEKQAGKMTKKEFEEEKRKWEEKTGKKWGNKGKEESDKRQEKLKLKKEQDEMPEEKKKKLIEEYTKKNKENKKEKFKDEEIYIPDTDKLNLEYAERVNPMDARRFRFIDAPKIKRNKEDILDLRNAIRFLKERDDTDADDIISPPLIPENVYETSPWDEDTDILKNLNLKTLSREELEKLEKLLEKI